MGLLKLFFAAFWWGSLGAVGFLVVPLLFANMQSTAEAGRIANVLFSAQTWVSIVCGLGLLAATKFAPQDDKLFTREPTKAQPSGWVVTGVFCALVIEYACAPHIAAHEDMEFWHNLATALFGLQWLCATGYLWRMYAKLNAK